MTDRRPYRILGITNDRVGPFGLLGVSPERCDRSTVLRALRLQLARIGVHPDARTPEAEELREELKAAADLLLDSDSLRQLREAYYNAAPASMMRADAIDTPSPPSAESQSTRPTSPGPTRPAVPQRPSGEAPASATVARRAAPDPARPRMRAMMTPLQSELVAALVGSGGWNARSRRRSVAIASRHRLTVNSLTSSLLSLSHLQSAAVDATAPAIERRRVARRDYELQGEPTGPAAAALAPGAAPADALDPEAIERARSEQAAARNLAAAVITFLICAVLTLPIAVFVLKELSTTDGIIQLPPPVEPLATENETDRFELPEGVTEQSGRALPLTLSGSLTQLDEDLRFDPGLSIEVQEAYRRVISEVRPNWIRLDEAGRERVRDVVISSFYEKGTRGDFVTILLNLIDPDVSTAVTPEAVIGRTWSTAMLMMLAAEADLPSAVREQVEDRLRRLNGRGAAAGFMTFDQACLVGLDAILPDLLREGLASEDAVSAWLAWCDVLATVATGEVREEKLFDAAQALLRSEIDLRDNKTGRHALAGILARVDWSNASVARRRFLAWYDDPRITSSDLAIAIGFLIALDRIPGLDETHALEPDANSQERIQARETLANLWAGEASESQLALDADRSSWLVRASRLLDEPLEENREDLFVQLIRLSRVNEAARHLEDHETESARAALRASTDAMTLASLLGERSAAGNRPPPLELTAPDYDGEFAVRFSKSTQAHDREGREDLIRELAATQQKDLGPADAFVLVDTALNGQPRVVREVALDALESAFANGPRTILMLADAITPGRSDGALSQAIERITGATLPPPKADSWYAEARLALLRHVQELRAPGPSRSTIDRLSRLLAESYHNRSAGSSGDEADEPDTAGAAHAAYERWVALARPMAPVNPIPGSLADIERRMQTRSAFSNDPVGLFGAIQLGILETALYVTSAERPRQRDELRQILREVTQERAAANSVLAQFIAVERGLILVWMIRLTAERTEVSI